MTAYATLQDRLQRAIVDGDDAVLDDLLDGARETRQVLIGVYRHAYSARLIEIIGRDFPLLRTLMGETAFDEAANAFVAYRGSTHRNARWVGRDFPEFLAGAGFHADRPALSELAQIERALADAFDAADCEPLTLPALQQTPPDAWPAMRFFARPGSIRLDLSTNAWALWSTLGEGEAPPEETTLDEMERLIVWRPDLFPMIRPMPAEEAMLWDEAARGGDFALLCTMAATYDAPDEAAGRVAGYLVGWINAQMLAQAPLEPADRAEA